MKRLVANMMTDCKGNIKERDAFYFVHKALKQHGYNCIQNASTIKECIFYKDLLLYTVNLTEWYLNVDNVVVLDVIELIENTNFDKEYLKKDVIPCNFTINDNLVKIDSEHTIYINQSKVKVDIDSTISLYKEVLKLAKSNGVKVGYTRRYKKTLLSFVNEFNALIEASDSIFNEIIYLANTIKDRKIHHGSVDDIYLIKLSKLHEQYRSYFYRSSTLGIIQDIYFELSSLYDGLKNVDDVRYTKINL